MAALLLFKQRVSRRWWLFWGLAVLATGFLVFSLRTPPATLSQFRPDEKAKESAAARSQANAISPGSSDPVSDVLEFQTVEEIQAALLSEDNRPTLVEIYSDFGIL